MESGYGCVVQPLVQALLRAPWQTRQGQDVGPATRKVCSCEWRGVAISAYPENLFHHDWFGTDFVQSEQWPEQELG